MSKEAMKLALEALQKIYIAPEHEEYIRVWWAACEQAITALREALAEQPAQQVVDCHATGVCVQSGLRAEQPRAFGTLAQQEPLQNNPFDCGVYLGSGKDYAIKHHVSYGPAQQEPVAWTNWRELVGARHYRTPGWEMYADKRNPDDVAIYTSPPSLSLAQRQARSADTWVGLTFAEICECENDYLHIFARAIEAKLKEKNT